MHVMPTKRRPVSWASWVLVLTAALLVLMGSVPIGYGEDQAQAQDPTQRSEQCKNRCGEIWESGRQQVCEPSYFACYNDVVGCKDGICGRIYRSKLVNLPGYLGCAESTLAEYYSCLEQSHRRNSGLPRLQREDSYDAQRRCYDAFYQPWAACVEQSCGRYCGTNDPAGYETGTHSRCECIGRPDKVGPTEAECTNDCVSMYGSHAFGKVQNGTCNCSCEFGYETDQTLTCVPSKAKCDQDCREYHGTDRRHGPEAYGEVVDGVCNCHCSVGYVPDETLTCVKRTEEKRPGKWCGDGKCESYIDPEFGLVDEDCSWCKPDCACPITTSCNPGHPKHDDLGCAKIVAVITDIGCHSGDGIPSATVTRLGVLKQEPGSAGTVLNQGDIVVLNAGTCEVPYITFDWGESRKGQLVLKDIQYLSISIGDNAVQSGWPTWKDTAQAVGWHVTVEVVGAATKKVGQIFSATVGTFIGLAADPDGAYGGDVRIYVKSHILIDQSPAGVNVKTLEGEALVQAGAGEVTVTEGRQATVQGDVISGPVAFIPDEIDRTYLMESLPPTGVVFPGEQDPDEPDGVEVSGAVLCGSLCGCTGLISLVLALGGFAVWQGRRRHQSQARSLGPRRRTPGDPGHPGPPAPADPVWGTLSMMGPASSSGFILDKPRLTIGRSSTSDLRLQDGLISSLHARIRREGGTALLDDLRSRNGTYVNGVRITASQPLKSGDVIHIGQTDLVFQQTVGRQRPTPGQYRNISLPREGTVFTIGRGSDSNLVLSDPSVSRRHAQLSTDKGVSMIRDLGSTSGTYVNEVRISRPTRLQPGNVIRLGRTELTI